MKNKRAMPNAIRQAFFSTSGKKAQELPGWGYIVALIIGIIFLLVLIWAAYKSGQVSVEQLETLK